MKRGDRLLCSPRDPVREAKNWYDKQKLSCNEKEIIVVGLGAGYHIAQLCESLPGARIVVFDRDKNCIESFKQNYPQLRVEIYEDAFDANIDINSRVLSFRPAFQGDEDYYLNLVLHLTCRSKEAFVRTAQRLGLMYTASVIETSDEKMINIKTVQRQLSHDFNNDETKMWLCLRELVL